MDDRASEDDAAAVLTQLWCQARDGDRAALAAAIRASQVEVWRFVAHQVGAAEADDVTQDVFVRAWRALPAFRADSSARTWLLSIARRAGADALRRRARGRRLRGRLESERSVTPMEEPDASGVRGIEELVAGLDARRREAFVLTQVVGCSYEEAAAICDVPVGTIRSRVARARSELMQRARAAETG